MALDRSRSISPSIMSAAIDPPRGLVIASGCWIVLAGFGAFGSQLPLHLSPAGLAPSVRLMLATCAGGMFVAWPLIRLSQVQGDRVLGTTMIDAISLACLWQLVLWPLRLATPWPIERALLVDIAAIATLAGVSGFVAAGSAWTRSSARGLAMICSLTLATGILLPLAAIGSPTHDFSMVFLGGIPTILSLMDSPTSHPTSGDWQAVAWFSLVNVGLLCLGMLIALASPLQAKLRGNLVAGGRRVG